MSYFQHDFVSNSDLKEIMRRHNGKEQPDNLQEIFDAGTLNHQALLESHKAKKWLSETVLSKLGADDHLRKYNLAFEMAHTVLRDDLCRKVLMSADFRREHEWYRRNIFGLEGARCKTDGDSKLHSLIFEYKGLSITSDRQFDDAIVNFDYDQSAYFYLNVVGFDNYLIVGVSKKQPDRLFKRLITRDHKFYHTGADKVRTSVEVWKSYGLK